MCDTGGSVIAVSSGDTVGVHPHWPQTRESGSLGGAAHYVQYMRKGGVLLEGEGGGGGEELPMVFTGSSRRDTQGNLRGDISGGQDNSDHEVNPVGGGSRDIRLGGREAGDVETYTGDSQEDRGPCVVAVVGVSSWDGGSRLEARGG